jgi:hypothetical protein
MSDELRRLKDWDDALMTSVLESANRDAPSSERVRGAALNLGLPAAAAARVVAAASHAANAGSAVAGGAHALGGAAGTATSSTAGGAALGGASGLVAKWIGIGALVGLATGGIAGRVLDHASSHADAPRTALVAPTKRPPPISVPRAPAAPRAVAATPEPTPRAAQPLTPAAPHPPAALAPSAAPPSSVAAFPAAAPHDDLCAELHMMDAARQALARDDANGALSELDRYTREVPRPQFSVEAMMLRVRALVALGRRDRARAIAERYVAAHPGDVYTAKLEALLGP